MKTLIIALVLLAGGAALAASVVCPLHTYAQCNNTYQLSNSGTAYKWSCTCGDDVWVAK